ncbi:hypothetical protein [Pseudoalteromonas luteoviolacea]|uniref:hypothetical protein n=1 Tax=Pseudoalteromonas luteoviolacea TaxID=43657 RepID=UPI001153D931|nr:hypothetical protein [Pseudoalteromonas luteoviolacea]TQF71256.1 hypothetical protein FLM44_09235 [Pseudoalteromonas luteoviolacea]
MRLRIWKNAKPQLNVFSKVPKLMGLNLDSNSTLLNQSVDSNLLANDSPDNHSLLDLNLACYQIPSLHLTNIAQLNNCFDLGLSCTGDMYSMAF